MLTPKCQATGYDLNCRLSFYSRQMLSPRNHLHGCLRHGDTLLVTACSWGPTYPPPTPLTNQRNSPNDIFRSPKMGRRGGTQIWWKIWTPSCFKEHKGPLFSVWSAHIWTQITDTHKTPKQTTMKNNNKKKTHTKTQTKIPRPNKNNKKTNKTKGTIIAKIFNF